MWLIYSYDVIPFKLRMVENVAAKAQNAEDRYFLFLLCFKMYFSP